MNYVLTPLSSLPLSWGVDGFYPYISIACVVVAALLFNGLIYFLFKVRTSLSKQSYGRKAACRLEFFWTAVPIAIFAMIIFWGYLNVQVKKNELTAMSDIFSDVSPGVIPQVSKVNHSFD